MQLPHTVDDVALGVDEYIPATQLIHAEAPAMELYDPALQPKHELAEVVEYVPALHVRHTDDAVAP